MRMILKGGNGPLWLTAPSTALCNARDLLCPVIKLVLPERPMVPTPTVSAIFRNLIYIVVEETTVHNFGVSIQGLVSGSGCQAGSGSLKAM